MIGDILSSIINTGGQLELGRQNRAAQAEENSKDRQMSWDMYQTQRDDISKQYQTMAKDLAAAGYNPILGYSNAGPNTAQGSPSGGGSLPPVNADFMGSLTALSNIKNAKRSLDQQDDRINIDREKVKIDKFNSITDAAYKGLLGKQAKGSLSGITGGIGSHIEEKQNNLKKGKGDWLDKILYTPFSDLLP